MGADTHGPSLVFSDLVADHAANHAAHDCTADVACYGRAGGSANSGTDQRIAIADSHFAAAGETCHHTDQYRAFSRRFHQCSPSPLFDAPKSHYPPMRDGPRSDVSEIRVGPAGV